MRGDRDRSHARPAAAMRDAEGLVQVDVADVGADLRRLGEAGERVQVGAVHVDLAAGGVHRLADLHDRLLEHAVRRRVGDHQRGEPRAVLGDLALEIRQVDIAVLVAGDHDDAQAHHLRAGRVGAVRRGRDQADVARALALRRQVVADREQPGVLALRAGVRLQRDAGEAGDFGEHAFQLADHRQRAAHLLGRREGMQRGEARPRHRQQLGGGIELHRARAERDHRVHQREVAVLEALQIPHHLGLGVVAVEHRMGRAPRRCGAAAAGSMSARRSDSRSTGFLPEMASATSATSSSEVSSSKLTATREASR